MGASAIVKTGTNTIHKVIHKLSTLANLYVIIDIKLSTMPVMV